MSIDTTDGRELRAVRSRAALFAAAVELVSVRGSANVPVTDLAEAAGVSRQLVYLHFADRDALLVAAATDLARRELALGGQSGRAVALLERTEAGSRPVRLVGVSVHNLIDPDEEPKRPELPLFDDA